MSEPKQGNFEGWAIVEMMGHQREIGFVTTEAYGGAVLFRIDTPALPDRDYTLKSPEWLDRRLLPTGSVVRRSAVPARTRLVAPAALYALNPCTEEVALKAIERESPRALILVSLPEGVALPAPAGAFEGPADDDDEDLNDDL